MELVDRILSLPEFEAEPPVLVEVGASGGTHRAWKALAQYSVCIAFDPDSRDMDAVHAQAGRYRRLHVFPAAAVPDDASEAEFYLTRSPPCSSLLRPDAAALGDWDFARLFDVERTVRVPCIPLGQALQKAGQGRVDWFKTDSQGIDLRLFRSLDESIRRRVLAVEFEPGIIDAYEGEDKMAAVLAEMDHADFWMSDLDIRGTLRISPDDAMRLTGEAPGRLAGVLPRSPGWGEMTYLNTFRGTGPFSRRDWLLGLAIALVKEQYGFALDLARRGRRAAGDPLFDELAAGTERTIQRKLRQGRRGWVLKASWRRLQTMAARLVSGPP